MRATIAFGLLCACTAALPAQAGSTSSGIDPAERYASLSPAGVSDTSVRQQYDIPSQPLDVALAVYGRQAGVRVTADAAAGQARSSAISGRYTAGEALGLLLSGSGFGARFTAADAVLVAAAARRDSVPQELRTVVVTGSSVRASGYVARRSSTATRTDTPLRDVPQAVTVVTREVIADQAMQGMADVVRYIPGITMGQGEGHRDAPTIRGNASTADFYVDGVRDDAQYLRDLYNVDRVEALKGSNAMVFGRGGGGGVINRVTKEAQWLPTREVTLEGGSFNHRRGSVDVGQGIAPGLAARLNGVYEKSGGFRDEASIKRFGVNPTLALMAGGRTMLRFGYELFDDERGVDRGIPSFQGRPSSADITTFFGDPDVSRSEARVHAGSMLVEHNAPSGLTIRNRSRVGSYDKFYQNVYPGAVNAEGTTVNLSAYNHAITRDNLFNQTDITYSLATGGVRHTLLWGAELGRQVTDNARLTGYFDDSLTTMAVAFDSPTISAPVTFRQSASDADAHATTNVAAMYVQDQLTLSRHVQAVVGLRYDRFGIRFRNNRTGDRLSRQDRMLSPRAGLLIKPVEPVSFYGSYSVSQLPGSGDQFSALSVTTRTLEPERFTNREVGVKWDVLPTLALSGAAYRLDRTNSSAPNPSDPKELVQTGGQRTTGYELGATGALTSAWQIAGGFAAQRARITSATTSAKEGATVPLVPARTFSLWNRYQVRPAWGVGLGVVHQSRMYAAVDNSVELPGFTRMDGALFVTLDRHVRAQLNVENLFDERYYATSHGNNNIMPGASRTLRLSLVTAF